MANPPVCKVMDYGKYKFEAQQRAKESRKKATNIVVKKANVEMLGLVYLAVIVLAFITFRSWQAVICAVLPLMLPRALALPVRPSVLPCTRSSA